MVGYQTSIFHKIVQSFYKSFFQRNKSRDINIAYFCQFLYISEKSFFFRAHDDIRPPCRQNLHIKILVCFDLLMIMKVIYRIIGRTNQCDIGHTDQIFCRHFRRLQFFVAGIVDLFPILLTECLVNIKISLQFQMTPMIHRISDGFWQCLCKSVEFFFIAGIAGNVFFRHSIGTHNTPFIVIPTEPQFCYIFKFPVFCYLLWLQMAVIVQNRCFFCIVVKKFFRCIC